MARASQQSNPGSASGNRSRSAGDGGLGLRLLAASAQDEGTVLLGLLRAAVEHGPDGVVVSISDLASSSDLQIVYVNPAFEALAEAEASALLGRSPLAAVDDLLDRRTRAALFDAVRKRIPLTLEYTRAAPADAKSYELRAVPIFREGEPLTEWVWTFVDVTKRVRRERRRRASLGHVLRDRNEQLVETREELRIMQRMAPLATLAAGLGHDMGNLLLPMRAHLDGLARVAHEPTVAGHVAALQGVLEYLQKLTDSLRLMALDPDRPLASSESTDLRDWWNTTEPLLSSVVRSAVRRVVVLPEGLPPVRVTPHLLTLAVLNLFVNANEAIPDEGEIRIEARPTADGAGVRLSVTDNGRGMAPDVRERAFDPFFSTKKRAHATGLGLALVHSVVRAAEGVVEIETREGDGTTITLTLPASEAAAGAGHERFAAVRVADARVAAWLRTMLSAAGFTAADDPALCSVLVTDPSPSALEEVQELRARGVGVRVFVYGTGGPGWDRLGAAVIAREARPSEIGRTFSQLLVGATDGGPK